MKIGFLGCGKIGRTIMEHAVGQGCVISFVQDPFYGKEEAGFPVIREGDSSVYEGSDLIIECATADALKNNFDQLIHAADMLIFSLTAFGDQQFMEHAKKEAENSGHHIYFPHGAILGLDGIFDARSIIDSASIETVKSPASLGVEVAQRTVVYEGSTRGACTAFPRNVNVHAAVAIAGIGFDRTKSRIIADPAATENTHVIRIKGEGIQFAIEVASFTTGGVTGVYTPLSACGSIDRILHSGKVFSFV